MDRHHAQGDGRYAMLIKAGDELSNSITGATAGRVGRVGIGLPSSHGKERFDTRHMACWFTLRATQTFKGGLFLGRK